jgi:putative hydrolase of the HAD superfamily
MNRAISFDLDGTLTTRTFVDAVWEEGVPSSVSRSYKIPEEAARFICRNAYEIIGDRSIRYYQLPFWLKHFGLDEDADEIIRNFSHRIALYSDVIPTLSRLKQQGFKLIIFSNATRLFLDEEMSRGGLNPYFDLVVSLPDDWNMLKSDPCTFSRLENVAGPFIHVGDSIHHDFIAPVKAGYNACHIFRGEGERHESSIDSLDDILDIVNG